MVLAALARRVDVEHDHDVRLRQGAAELAREHRGARVQVRLEDRHQASRRQRARGPERSRDLAWRVGVVVVDQRTRARAAEQLEAPARARERRKSRDRALLLGARNASRLESRGRVQRVVLARNAQAHLGASPAEARPLRIEHRARLLIDRKSTRLNSSHVEISYAVFCLKKKKKKETSQTRIKNITFNTKANI